MMMDSRAQHNPNEYSTTQIDSTRRMSTASDARSPYSSASGSSAAYNANSPTSPMPYDQADPLAAAGGSSSVTANNYDVKQLPKVRTLMNALTGASANNNVGAFTAAPMDETNPAALATIAATMLLEPGKLRQALQTRRDELQQEVNSINSLLSHSSKVLQDLESIITKATSPPTGYNEQPVQQHQQQTPAQPQQNSQFSMASTAAISMLSSLLGGTTPGGGGSVAGNSNGNNNTSTSASSSNVLSSLLMLSAAQHQQQQQQQQQAPLSNFHQQPEQPSAFRSATTTTSAIPSLLMNGRTDAAIPGSKPSSSVSSSTYNPQSPSFSRFHLAPLEGLGKRNSSSSSSSSSPGHHHHHQHP
ncbi:hypothetical protein BDB00DRAFT_795982 [Zychaea mexicana]|uniref:uncharacterized protein n=1 Tax=Zychaea mexicana TaxID=64656 RepID=UPI0022FF21E1|nr:uncharacterized protein BDB00DRAFT_795982 [Zychaea mexicana]KAI9499239.1 hypothetical protein BDB00DRAFT_795982 [Zychaea mexicana]